MDRYGSIYLITNTVTKEQYVGQTRQKKAINRWKSHIKKEKPLPKEKKEKVKIDPIVARMNAAKLKWKPVYCPQIQCSFLSRKFAAEYLGVLKTSISNAIKQKGMVANMYTMESVV